MTEIPLILIFSELALNFLLLGAFLSEPIYCLLFQPLPFLTSCYSEWCGEPICTASKITITSLFPSQVPKGVFTPEKLAGNTSISTLHLLRINYEAFISSPQERSVHWNKKSTKVHKPFYFQAESSHISLSLYYFFLAKLIA